MAPGPLDLYPLDHPPPDAAAALRLRVRVRGLVQGVGFRPHVYTLARRHALGGWVLNDADGVLLEVEGAAVQPFLRDLVDKAPPLSRIDGVESAIVPAEGAMTFTIRDSGHGGAASTAIGPDTGLCADCLGEMCDPADRRYGYAFITCTNCGPRYTIARGLPYDRPLTSMAGFPLCPACDRDYHDPGDRRFHAQPLACPVCGPRLSMPVDEVVDRLRRGEIVAIKGLGGFHLACDARDAAAVDRLRQR
ncbi:MAG: carbamoyltransferase HypF, partial [Pseudomonadota bacterium]